MQCSVCVLFNFSIQTYFCHFYILCLLHSLVPFAWIKHLKYEWFESNSVITNTIHWNVEIFVATNCKTAYCELKWILCQILPSFTIKVFYSSSQRFEYEMVLRWCLFSKAQITKCITNMKIDEFTFRLTIPDSLRRNQFFIGLKCIIVIINIIIIILMVVFVGCSMLRVRNKSCNMVFRIHILDSTHAAKSKPKPCARSLQTSFQLYRFFGSYWRIVKMCSTNQIF